jgi:hypothetical protein
MKTLVPIQALLGLCAMLSLEASAQTYVTLAAKAGTYSQTIELSNNMVATVVHLRSSGSPPPSLGQPVPDANSGYLEVAINGTYITYTVPDLIFGQGTSASNAAAANLPTIASPARLTVKTGVNGSALCTLAIGQPAPLNIVPKDVVSIPSMWGTSANLILQSSSDLFTWDNTSIGTYGPPLTNRFFRLLVQPATK